MAGLALIGLLLVGSGTGPVAAGLASQAVIAPAASDGSSWFRIRTNLSNSANLDSGYPDVATDSSGEYVAVVWTEGYDSSEEAKHHGSVYLRWISESGGAWSQRIQVNDGTSYEDDWATDVAVALEDTTPPTVHIVWVRFEKASGYRVMYRACVLGGSSCGSSLPLAGPTGQVLASPDIAVDSSGRLFVVWMRVVVARQNQVIDYTERSGAAWSPPVGISSGVYNDWPVVAVKGDKVYLAWNQTPPPDQQGQYYVMSRQKDVAGSWSASENVYFIDKDLRNPFLAANDSTVCLVWEKFDSGKDYEVNYKCDDADSGWEPSASQERKVIADAIRVTISDFEPEYLQYLRPALAWGHDGALYAVWHHYSPPAGEGDPDVHEVLYSSSTSPTLESPTWSEADVFAPLSGEGEPFLQDNVAARIAVGPPRNGGEPHIHVVLMLRTSDAWDVWYLSNQRYHATSMPIVMKRY